MAFIKKSLSKKTAKQVARRYVSDLVRKGIESRKFSGQYTKETVQHIRDELIEIAYDLYEKSNG